MQKHSNLLESALNLKERNNSQSHTSIIRHKKNRDIHKDGADNCLGITYCSRTIIPERSFMKKMEFTNVFVFLRRTPGFCAKSLFLYHYTN